MSSSDRERALTEVFVAIADAVDAQHGVIDTMTLLVEAATTFTTATEAAIVLADAAGELHVIASTSERSADVEEAQAGTHQGPCWEAFHSQALVEVPDLTVDTARWPDFVRAAGARGFRSAHAVPLHIRDEMLGSLNLFAPDTGRLTDHEAAIVQALAAAASLSIVPRPSDDPRAPLDEQLREALDSRVIIEQAKGFLAHQDSTSVDAAFRSLRGYARRNAQRMHDVADGIINRRLTI